MITHGHVFCDCCGLFLGKLWNEPAYSRDVLPAPDFRLCLDCLPAPATPLGPQPFAPQKEGGRG